MPDTVYKYRTPSRRGFDGRKIIHVDMDAFFAAVEQRDHPAWRGRPVIVGGDPDRRGVVATCSYEARRYGIRSAMPSARARRLCPHAIFVRPRFDAYREASRRIHAVFRRYTDLIEPLSLDEAYLDVTGCRQEGGSATRIARAIKRHILDDTGLTASAGVSYNKLLAKIASDMDKPDGLTVIPPGLGEALAASLPVGRFHGIGRATEARMHELGIHTGADLRAWPLDALRRTFGKAGEWYYRIARGIDPRPVVGRRSRKSLGSETTFPRDLTDPAEIRWRLEEQAAEAVASLRSEGLRARTLTIKVKYADFELVTRSHTLAQPCGRLDTLLPWLERLLARTEAGRRPVRLLGVTLSGLVSVKRENGPLQLELFRNL